MIYIYTLSHPITKYVYYVGKTNNPHGRYNAHVTDFGKITPNKYWIKSLVKNGMFPIMDIVDCIGDEEWVFWEKFYIDLYKSWGFELNNCRGYVYFKEKLPNVDIEKMFNFRLKLLPVPKYYLDAGLHDIDGEIWKDIPNYIGLYQASNLGRLKSLSRSVQWVGCRRYKITKEFIMKQSSDRDGYKILTFNIKKKKRQFRVHRLILLAFIGIPPIGKELCMHLDDNPSNNVLTNLQWGSNSENEKQAYARGRKTAPRIYGVTGSKHSSSKKVIQMDMAGNHIKLHLSISEAGTYCNVKANNISSCLIGKQFTSGGYRWKYA